MKTTWAKVGQRSNSSSRTPRASWGKVTELETEGPVEVDYEGVVEALTEFVGDSVHVRIDDAVTLMGTSAAGILGPPTSRTRSRAASKASSSSSARHRGATAAGTAALLRPLRASHEGGASYALLGEVRAQPSRTAFGCQCSRLRER
jgi:hypothetical protein